MTGNIQHWQFSVDDFSKMLATGILREDDRVELMDGEIISMSPIGPLHNSIVSRISRFAFSRLGTSHFISVQSPVRLNDHTEPLPDLAVMRPRADDYDQSLPAPADILLIVEVGDSSVEFDRDQKIPRYAAAGIPEVWLIAAQAATISQYTGPAGDKYAEVLTLSIGRSVECRSITGFSVTVAEVLRSQAARS